ncbi:MAG: hypothetical protein ACFFCI_17615 [Promethearchaeota archaeon]
MKKSILSIITLVFALVTAVFMGLWLYIIIFPFFDRAQLAANLGYSILDVVPVPVILAYVFLNIYFIIMAVFGITTLILALISKILNR